MTLTGLKLFQRTGYLQILLNVCFIENNMPEKHEKVRKFTSAVKFTSENSILNTKTYVPNENKRYEGAIQQYNSKVDQYRVLLPDGADGYITLNDIDWIEMILKDYIRDALRDLVSATIWLLHGHSNACKRMLTIFSTFMSFLSVCMSQHGNRTGLSNVKLLNAIQTGKHQQSNDI